MTRPDLDTPEQIADMVRRFYTSVDTDDILGPVFNDVARVDWDRHLPKLTAFWARALLGIDGFYAGGARACLLNVFGADEGPFTLRIKDALNALIAAFAKLAADAGQPAERAGRSAERAATMLQGSLVLSRGLGTQTPFRNMLLELPRELLK